MTVTTFAPFAIQLIRLEPPMESDLIIYMKNVCSNIGATLVKCPNALSDNTNNWFKSQ